MVGHLGCVKLKITGEFALSYKSLPTCLIISQDKFLEVELQAQPCGSIC